MEIEAPGEFEWGTKPSHGTYRIRMNEHKKQALRLQFRKKKILDIEISLYFFSSAEIPLLSPSFSQPWPFCFHSYSPCCCAFNFGFHIKMCKWSHTKYLLATNIYSTKWNEQTAQWNILALSIKRIAKSHTSFAICFQLLSFFFSGSECDQIKWENKIKTFISWAWKYASFSSAGVFI